MLSLPDSIKYYRVTEKTRSFSIFPVPKDVNLMTPSEIKIVRSQQQVAKSASSKYRRVLYCHLGGQSTMTVPPVLRASICKILKFLNCVKV